MIMLDPIDYMFITAGILFALMLMCCAADSVIKWFKKHKKAKCCVIKVSIILLVISIPVSLFLAHRGIDKNGQASLGNEQSNTIHRGEIDTLQADYSKMSGRLKSLESRVPGGDFKEGEWKSSYKKTEQFGADCFTWQTKHPEVVAKEEVECRSNTGYCKRCVNNHYGRNNNLCDFTIRKKAPDGKIYDVECQEQKDPNDFI